MGQPATGTYAGVHPGAGCFFFWCGCLFCFWLARGLSLTDSRPCVQAVRSMTVEGLSGFASGEALVALMEILTEVNKHTHTHTHTHTDAVRRLLQTTHEFMPRPKQQISDPVQAQDQGWCQDEDAAMFIVNSAIQPIFSFAKAGLATELATSPGRRATVSKGNSLPAATL